MRTSFDRRSLMIGAFGVALGAAVFTSAHEAQAAGGPTAELVIIHATNCDKPHVDEGIGEVPPLKYTCYKKLGTQQLPLTKGQASTAKLDNARTFHLLYSDLTPDNRYKLTASISNADGSQGYTKLADITAEPNKRFHVGGFTYQGGALVLAIRVIPPAK